MENGHKPPSKQDLENLKVEVNTRFEQVGNRLENFKVEVNTRFEEFEHRLEGFLHDMEGRIITSTYVWPNRWTLASAPRSGSPPRSRTGST